jgi:hypothetical protein
MVTMSTSPPSVAWISATLAKTGNRDEENEDAVATDAEGLRFALADGATEGWQSGAWAAHLATAYIRTPPGPADFDNWLAATRRGWTPPAVTGSVAWYTEVKQQQGSFAAIVGVEFRRTGEGGWAWKAVAVGDSCLLQIRGGKLETAFPLASAEGFGNAPPLIGSSASPCPPPEWLAGRAEPADLFLLATDAVAAHLMGLKGKGWDAALSVIRDAITSQDSAGLHEFLRNIQKAHNDDASLIAIRIPDAASAS